MNMWTNTGVAIVLGLLCAASASSRDDYTDACINAFADCRHTGPASHA